ncbi:MAG: hypothetical protein HQL77_06265 [Magnetococcales bacterium]|nr:hypothetical protein [Magnetococcales bacterium]
MKQSLLIAAACVLAISMAPLALSAATDQDLPGQPAHYYANGVWHIYGDHYVRMFDPPVTSVAAFPAHDHAVGQPNQFYEHGVWHLNGRHVNRNSRVEVIELQPTDAESTPAAPVKEEATPAAAPVDANKPESKSCQCHHGHHHHHHHHNHAHWWQAPFFIY